MARHGVEPRHPSGMSSTAPWTLPALIVAVFVSVSILLLRQQADIREIKLLLQPPKRAVWTGGLQKGPGGMQCKRLIWFTTLHLRQDNNFKSEYIDYLEVALVSAMKNAPGLVPVLVYDGPPQPFTSWFKEMGGQVVYVYLSFYKQVKAAELQGGAAPFYADSVRSRLLILDLPKVFAEVAAGYGPDVDKEYYLFSDSDVMFLQDIDSCSLDPPPLLAMGPSYKRGMAKDLGVSYVNASALEEQIPVLLAHGLSHNWGADSADPTLISDVLSKQIDALPDEFDWKGFWGPPAAAQTEVVVFHWHGPKPFRCLPCLMTYPDSFDNLCATRCNAKFLQVFNESITDTRVLGYFKDMLSLFYDLREDVQRMQHPGVAGNGLSGGISATFVTA